MNISEDSASFNVLATSYINDFYTHSLSCFSLPYGIVQCQYQQSNYSVNVAIYNSTTLELLKDNSIGYYRGIDGLFKAIHLKNLIGVYSYYYTIQILKLNVNDYTFQNYVPGITKLNLQGIGISICPSYSHTDLIKMSEIILFYF